jgi:hypothetical protein
MSEPSKDGDAPSISTDLEALLAREAALDREGPLFCESL